MPEKSQKRKLRSDQGTSQEEIENCNASNDENVSLSEQDFEDISNKIENRLSKRLRDTEFGQREILRLIENLASKVDNLSNSVSEQCSSAVHFELETDPIENTGNESINRNASSNTNSQLIVAGSNIKLKKEVKYLGIIIDDKLPFEYQVKSVLKKMALGIKAIQTIRNNLPKKCLKVLLHALVLSHFEYCNLLLTDISSALLLYSEKQLNWALKTVFYRSRNKCSTSLRISEEILSMKQRIDLKSFDLLYSILKNERSAFQNHLKLPTMSFRIIERNKKIY